MAHVAWHTHAHHLNVCGDCFHLWDHSDGGMDWKLVWVSLVLYSIHSSGNTLYLGQRVDGAGQFRILMTHTLQLAIGRSKSSKTKECQACCQWQRPPNASAASCNHRAPPTDGVQSQEANGEGERLRTLTMRQCPAANIGLLAG